MALRLDPVRMLIADHVGIGKTIEAGLIARELLDRGDAKRICVLCPPHICDQWQRELDLKLHINAVIVRTSTVAGLERQIPRKDDSLYRYYPHLIVSMDFAKSDRRRPQFLEHCPDLVIVDEAHTAKDAGVKQSHDQQQRHELVRDVSRDSGRHLLLLTATPHSGIEGIFRSLLRLLNEHFAQLDLAALKESVSTGTSMRPSKLPGAANRMWLQQAQARARA
jgi:SNF2 family DNA or RNA helicase